MKTFFYLLLITFLFNVTELHSSDDDVVLAVDPATDATRKFEGKIRILAGFGKSGIDLKVTDNDNYNKELTHYGGMTQLLFGVGPHFSLGFEAGYRHYGKVKNKHDSGINAEYNVLQLAGVFELYLTRSFYFALAIGGTFDLGIYSDSTDERFDTDESFCYALSMGYDFYFDRKMFIPLVFRFDLVSIYAASNNRRGYIYSGTIFTGFGFDF